MSKFDTFRERYKQNSSGKDTQTVSKFDSFRKKYKENLEQSYNTHNLVANVPNPEEKQYSTGNRVASIAKSAVSGAVGVLPDTAALAYNLPAMGVNAVIRNTDTSSQPFDGEDILPQLPQSMGGHFSNINQNRQQNLGEEAPQLPLIPSATHAIDKGIDSATGGYTETPEDQKHWNQGIEFATGIAGGGGLAAGAKALGKTGVAKVGNFAGSLNPWHVGGAGAAGIATSKLEQSGSSTAGSMTGGLAADAAVQSMPSMWNSAKGIKSLPAKVAVAATGLGKKNFNVKAAKNAQELGIDLPATPFTNSNSTRLADQLIGKTPILGNKLQNKYKKAEEQTKKVLENIYDATGQANTEEVQQKIAKLYAKRVSALPKDAAITPTHTMKAINDIRIDSIHPSPDEKALMEVVNSFKNEFTPQLKSKFGNVNIPVQESGIQRLADSKKSLNSLIKWDVDEGVKNRVRLIQKGLANDISEYGKLIQNGTRLFKKQMACMAKLPNEKG